jgi:hypothetical protein
MIGTIGRFTKFEQGVKADVCPKIGQLQKCIKYQKSDCVCDSVCDSVCVCVCVCV